MIPTHTSRPLDSISSSEPWIFELGGESALYRRRSSPEICLQLAGNSVPFFSASRLPHCRIWLQMTSSAQDQFLYVKVHWLIEGDKSSTFIYINDLNSQKL